ncbi:MAG TPA: vitamin K epoxide reductase family protein [Candidatus Paceibacterota bacterium]|nr:vitamin K epoxide reductase family protein [Candidatus Paceibacterota bacterium]
MIIPSDMWMRILLFVLGAVGFGISFYIHKKKKIGKPLVCMVNFDCDGVVKSQYSKFLGIELEVIGMVYYAFMALLYLVLIFLATYLLPIWFLIFLVAAPFFAFLFSLYLLYVQIFLLKKGCSWCFFSSAVCILIFIVTIVIYF